MKLVEAGGFTQEATRNLLANEATLFPILSNKDIFSYDKKSAVMELYKPLNFFTIFTFSIHKPQTIHIR